LETETHIQGRKPFDNGGRDLNDSVKARSAKNYQEPPEAGRDKEGFFPREFRVFQHLNFKFLVSRTV